MKRSKLLAVILFLSVACGIFFTSNSVFAADYSNLLKKWMFTQYYQCINTSSNMTSPVKVKDYGSNEKVLEKAIRANGTMYLPSYSLAGRDSLNCQGIAKGNSSLKNGAQGAVEYNSSGDTKITFSDPEGLTSLLTDRLPYKRDAGGDPYFSIKASRRVYEKTCNFLSIFTGCDETTVTEEEHTVNIYAKKGSDGKYSYSIDDGWANWGNNLKLTINKSTKKIKIELDSHYWGNALGLNKYCFESGDAEAEASYSESSVQTTYDNINGKLANLTWAMECDQSVGGGTGGGGVITPPAETRNEKYWFDFTSGDIVDASDQEEFEYDSSKVDASVKAYSGYSSHSGAAFSNTDFYNLYKYYLDNAIPGGGVQNSMTCDPTDTTNLTKVKMFDAADNEFKDCYVNFNGQWDTIKSTTVYTQDSSAIAIVTITIEDIVNWFNTVDPSTINADEIDATTDSNTEDPGEEGEDSKPSCTTNAHELGWIICPIVTGTSSFLKDFYENWITPFLSIDVGIFRFDGSEGSVEDDSAQYSQGNIYGVWQAFQGIANLAFVVLFLVVIFSQLTGIGIDNYGIKKILPKLIVCAVLINLSYIICMLAVELSNIIGLALKSLFTQSAFVPDVSGIQVKVNPSTPNSEEIPALGINLAVIGIIAGLTIPYALSVGWAIIIPALVLVLSVLLSMFFLFAMLGIRQALVIILVCISPLAFVCYTLPNTKKLFDKWFNVFKAMLLAYPICSALVYGGDLVAKILLVANQSSSSVISSVGILFTAAIISIAPVFMIPGLIRKGLDAVGGLGAKISGLQGRAKGATDKRVRNTGFARDLENRRANIEQFRDKRRQRRKAGLKADGTLSARGKAQNAVSNIAGKTRVGRFMTRNTDASLASRRQAALGSISEATSGQRYMTATGLAAAQAGLLAKAEQAEIDDEITNMKDETGNYHADTMRDMLRDNLANGGSDTRMRALVSKLASTPDGTRHLIKIAQETKGAGARRLAQYMTQSDVAGKIASKDTYVAQYMKDLAAGLNGAVDSAGNAAGFEAWASATHEGSGLTNAQNISQNVLDKDEDLVGQNQASFERSFAAMDQSQVGDRARRMLDNENIRASLTQGKIEWLQQHAAPATSSSAPTVVNKDNYVHSGRNGRTATLTTYSDGTVRDEHGNTVDLKDWTKKVKNH